MCLRPPRLSTLRPRQRRHRRLLPRINEGRRTGSRPGLVNCQAVQFLRAATVGLTTEPRPSRPSLFYPERSRHRAQALAPGAPLPSRRRHAPCNIRRGRNNHGLTVTRRVAGGGGPGSIGLLVVPSPRLGTPLLLPPRPGSAGACEHAGYGTGHASGRARSTPVRTSCCERATDLDRAHRAFVHPKRRRGCFMSSHTHTPWPWGTVRRARRAGFISRQPIPRCP
jgi:hypothetical protein